MIQAENLAASYIHGGPVLRGISFSLTAGERAALIGANGAGKSTLLLALAGELPPASGRVRIDGIPVEKKTLNQARRKLGFVFQNPDDQLFMPTVYEDIAFGPRNYETPEDLIKERAEKVLAALGIAHLAERMTAKLSGGEKRLAALAGVLVMEPRALLLDEPTSFLDPRARRRLIGILESLPQTILVATHDMDFARLTCERVLLLKNGQLAADGKTADILGNAELLEDCGL